MTGIHPSGNHLLHICSGAIPTAPTTTAPPLPTGRSRALPRSCIFPHVVRSAVLLLTADWAKTIIHTAP